MEYFQEDNLDNSITEFINSREDKSILQDRSVNIDYEDIDNINIEPDVYEEHIPVDKLQTVDDRTNNIFTMIYNLVKYIAEELIELINDIINPKNLDQTPAQFLQNTIMVKDRPIILLIIIIVVIFIIKKIGNQ